MTIHMNLGADSYDILVERGLLPHAKEHLNLNRRVLVVTDSGVPARYAQCVAAQCKNGIICTVEQGEGSKSLETFGTLLQTMLDHGFSRKDCVVAVGGGVVGDLSGFAASAYMRGIDFYNIPTTLLSQIDSSIGGKTAINFGGVKNIVGAFYQPKKVLIDPDLLQTLPQRQLSNGLAEAIKMSLTSDRELFELLENEDVEKHLDTVIIRSLLVKKNVVEQDERETSLRKILNFGHTIGHGIESSENLSELYHGECVALGMIPMCHDSIRPRVIRVLRKCHLYRIMNYDWDEIAKAAFHDKKADGDTVTVTTVHEIGSFRLQTMKCTDLMELAKSKLTPQYGCIGKKLTHSFSKEIHAKLADYPYELIELAEEEIGPFLTQRSFSAINVTIPYKQTVIPYLDSVSDVARRIGAVNTIVNRDGKLYGYNTDYYGMKALIRRVGLDLTGKKVLILGTGGTGKTARVLATDLGASEIHTVSRQASPHTITYGEAVTAHADAHVIINTTPSGMYPDCEGKPIDITPFPQLEGVIDAVYNPLCTNLVLDARRRGVKAEGGLYMLVMQAVAAVEKFLNTEVDREAADRVYAAIMASKENIVLTGMPGSGKSTVGRLLQQEGFTFIDTDAEVEARCGCTIKELIAAKGEPYFRDLESEVIRDVSSEACRIISTGGGAILREENVRHLKQNGKLYFLDAPLSRLRATEDRPLSNTEDKLAKLYADRMPLYKATADVVIPNANTPAEEAEAIITKRMELIL